VMYTLQKSFIRIEIIRYYLNDVTFDVFLERKLTEFANQIMLLFKRIRLWQGVLSVSGSLIIDILFIKTY
jgi:hypothetical protein